MGLGAAGVVQTLTAMPTAWWLESEVTTSILLAVTRPMIPLLLGSRKSIAARSVQTTHLFRQGAQGHRPSSSSNAAFKKRASIDRAIGQMEAYAMNWRGKPCLLVIFEARVEHLFECQATQGAERILAPTR